MADSTLQIIVGGNGDAALAVLQRIADGVDSLSEKVKQVNPPEAPDAKNALQQLEDHLVSLQGLPGPLGEGIRAVTSAISEMGVVGEAAGAAVDGALSPVLITVGLIIVAVAALAVSIAGLIAESENLVNMAAAWSSQVRAFQSLTGATAEYASTLLYVAEVAGVSSEAVSGMVKYQDRLFYAATEQQTKIAEGVAAQAASTKVKEEQAGETKLAHLDTINEEELAKLKTLHEKEGAEDQAYSDKSSDIATARSDKLAQAAESHEKRLTDLKAQGEADRASYEEQVAQRSADFDHMRQNEAEALAASLASIETAHAQRVQDEAQAMSDAYAAYAQRVSDLTQSMRDAQESYAQRVEDIQARLADQKSSIDDRAAAAEQANAEKNAVTRESILERISASGDQYERAAQQAQLAAFDAQAAAQKAALDAKAADEKAKLDAKVADEEAKAKAAEDKAIAQLQQRIDRENAAYAAQDEKRKQSADRENAAYDAQTAKMTTDAAKRAAEEQRTFDLQESRAAAANVKQLAAVQKRIEDEGVAYAKQTESIEKETDKQFANIEKAHEKQIAANSAAQDKIYEDTQKRVDKEDEAYKKSVLAAEKSLADYETKASENLPPTIRAVKELGLNWDEIAAMPAAEQTEALFRAIQKVPDAATKAGIESKIYGRNVGDINKLIDAYTSQSLPDWVQATQDSHKYLTTDGVAALKTYGISQRELSTKWEGMQEQLGRDLVPAFQKFNDKLLEFWDKHGKEITKFLENLIGVLLPALLTMLDQVFDKLDSITGDNGAASQISDLLSLLAPQGTLAGSLVDLLATVFGIVGAVQHRATGGDVQSGTPYLVGEHGPEIIVPGNNGYVIPNDQLQKSGGSSDSSSSSGNGSTGGGTTNNFYITANYANQPEVDLRRHIQMLQRLAR